ncbi:MAG: 50S ribosomal protein L25 [Deltaproteobacteria bacterium]|nr:50S ribosomal protein L25 [Deltaproteobacteria bacterium]
MKTMTLEAWRREDTGKGACRRLRAEGRVPAVFYGYQADPVSLSVRDAELIRLIEMARIESLFVNLAISDDDTVHEKLSIIKDYQVNSVKKHLVHADFYEIKMDREVVIELPISLVGEPAGLEQGGELTQSKRELKVSGLPSILPEAVEVNVSHLELGDSLRVADVALAEGITALDSEDSVIATVVATRRALTAAEMEQAEAAEAAEEASAVEEAAEEAAAEEGSEEKGE